MAKKRVKARAKARPVKIPPSFAVADIMVIIASLFMLLSAIIVFAFPDFVVGIAAKSGIETTAANWNLLATAWIFLAIFGYTANRFIRAYMHKATMWGLLIIGLLTLLTGRIVYPSAVLMIVAAIVYMINSKQ